MKRITKEKGITLITLCVTIIIIFILAIVSILQVIDKEGILQDSNLSKERNLEKTAKEQIDLACSTIKIVIAEAVSKDGSYSAKANYGLIHATLIDILNADIMNLDGAFKDGGKIELDNKAKIVVVYEGADYRNICKYEKARIIYTIEITQRDIQLIEESMITSKNQEPEDETIVNNTVNDTTMQKYTDLGRSIILIVFIVSLVLLIIIIAVVMFVLKQKDIKKEISKTNSVKDTARETVKNACESIKLDEFKNDNISEIEFLTLLKSNLVEKLNETKGTLNGTFKINDDTNKNSKDSINLIYEGEDYKASNKTGKSKINYVIGVEEDSLNLVKEDSTIIGIN